MPLNTFWISTIHFCQYETEGRSGHIRLLIFTHSHSNSLCPISLFELSISKNHWKKLSRKVGRIIIAQFILTFGKPIPSYQKPTQAWPSCVTGSLNNYLLRSYDTLNFEKSKRAELGFQKRTGYQERFNMCIHISNRE